MYTKEELEKAYEAGIKSVKQNASRERRLEQGAKQIEIPYNFENWFEYDFNSQVKEEKGDYKLLEEYLEVNKEKTIESEEITFESLNKGEGIFKDLIETEGVYANLTIKPSKIWKWEPEKDISLWELSMALPYFQNRCLDESIVNNEDNKSWTRHFREA